MTPTFLQVLEALLLLTDEPLQAEEIEQWVQAPPLSQLVPEGFDLPMLMRELAEDYNARQSPLELRQVAEGWQLTSRPAFAPYLQLYLTQKEQRKLSRAALECLAIVAYRQPLTRSELEHIRGVNSDYALQKLLEKELVEPAGRAELPGKPLLYRTSHAFLTYFGLKNLEELPKLKEVKHEEENPGEFQTQEEHPQTRPPSDPPT